MSETVYVLKSLKCTTDSEGRLQVPLAKSYVDLEQGKWQLRFVNLHF